MTRRSGTGRPKRLAAAVLAGGLLLIPATLASTGGRLFLPVAAAIADGSSLPGAGDLLAALHSATAEPEEYGASGNLPESDTLSPELLAALAGPATPSGPSFGTGAGALASVPPGPLGLPGVMLDAYMRAAGTLAATYPHCGLHWSVLAAIGRIESNHARGGAVDAKGTTVQPILGPQLSGGPGVAAIRDSDGGLLDGDAVWDRAVGPMQFIPGTWARYAVDGNNDGVASPHNIYDSTLAAGHYLCAGSGDLRDPVALAEAIFRYNHSEAYVTNVLSWAAAYATGVTPLPSVPAPVLPVGELPPTTTPPSTTPPSTTTAPTTTTTTTTGSSTTTPTTPTCPTAPTGTTDPSSTAPTTTVPPGCETTTTPPPSTSETTSETTTQTTTDPTQSAGGTVSSSESSTLSSADPPPDSSASSTQGSSGSSESSTSSGGAASTTTSLPAA